MNFEWATQYPEIQKICILFERSELSNPRRWRYCPLQGSLQEGPQCGLVALAMLTGSPTKDKIELIFQSAKEQGFTHNGEMFSAKQMCHLAKIFLPNYTVELYEGYLKCNQIQQFLLNGGALLVPYDTNKDNSPGFHKGHKAHWCAVSGVVETLEDFYVIARHGKAKNVAIWSIDNLAQSNQQLHEFSPDRKLQDLEYLLPEGGIAGPLGLNKKCILIYSKGL